MKALLTTVCFILFLGCTIKSHAQTKEETVKWIKEKIEKYPMHNKNIVKSIDSCKIIVEDYALVNGKEILHQTHTIPTNPIAVSSIIFLFEGKVVETNYQGKLEYDDSAIFFDTNREPDLGNRMLKALQYLNTFCEKKKEIF